MEPHVQQSDEIREHIKREREAMAKFDQFLRAGNLDAAGARDAFFEVVRARTLTSDLVHDVGVSGVLEGRPTQQGMLPLG